MGEPSVRIQWALIGAAAVFAVGLGIWSISAGRWYLFAGLVLASVFCGLWGWWQGLPLYPGADQRADDADRL